MNLFNAFDELDKLYESAVKPEKVIAEQEAAVEADAPVEAVEDEEIEIVEDDSEAEVEAVEDTDNDGDAAEEDTPAQLVLECENCGGIVVRAETEVSFDDNTDLANVGETCQYCEEAVGYKVLGSICPYNSEETAGVDAEEEVEYKEEPDEEVVEESLLDIDLPIDVDIKADGNNVPFLNTGI